ncbi:DUF1674 domain-containing protein [Oleiagrimonas sp. C23AA]|uniref:DUF1674 domain-containing protein n=1 Tax=Oleiagrimonas sp. C23AA TaxID=2719047 RepID=UPI001F0E111B|nr:DUF1674 domain-containing protein [Oleiagrimonas sp. C23AA]
MQQVLRFCALFQVPMPNNVPQSEHDSKPAQDAPKRPQPDADERTEERPDPTRYGDWEKDGRCIDF